MEALLKRFIKILTLMNLATQALGGASCNLKYFNNEWLDDWHVLLTHNESTHQYQLFRDNKVASDQNIIWLCNNDREPVTVTCRSNLQFSENLPLNRKCQESESLMPIRIAEKVSYCPHTLYKIGFNIKTDLGTQFLEAYQVCFDQNHIRTLFSISKAYPLGGGRLKDLQFNPDDIFYGKLFSAFSRRSTFERFQKLLGNTQTYMSATNPEHIIDRGHLTPSADFTFTNLKRSTFNMINVMPQFKTIDNGNWRLIEEWTRHPSRTPANVCTGVLDCNLDAANIADLHCVVRLRANYGFEVVPMFLADNRRIPIPLWSYKIVKNSRNSLVFLTLNNIYHSGSVEVPPHICLEIECPLKLPRTIKDGWTLCCSYTEFINNNLPFLRQVC